MKGEDTRITLHPSKTRLKMAAAFTWVLPDPTLYDLTDVLESLSILLHAVVAQADVVGEV